MDQETIMLTVAGTALVLNAFAAGAVIHAHRIIRHTSRKMMGKKPPPSNAHVHVIDPSVNGARLHLQNLIQDAKDRAVVDGQEPTVAVRDIEEVLR